MVIAPRTELESDGDTTNGESTTGATDGTTTTITEINTYKVITAAGTQPVGTNTIINDTMQRHRTRSLQTNTLVHACACVACVPMVLNALRVHVLMAARITMCHASLSFAL